MEKREEYISKLHKMIDDIDSAIIDIENKFRKESQEFKTRFAPEISELKEKKKIFEEKLSKLKDSGDEAWKKVRTGLEAAAVELRKAFKEAAGKFK